MNPGHVLVDSFACHEEREIVQPLPAVVAKGIEGAAVGSGSVRKERLGGFVEESLLKFNYAAERHLLVWETRRIHQVLRRQKAILTKSRQIDEQGISGECRKALVRRIAVSGWTQRQHLPDLLSGAGQKIDELASRFSEITDPMRAGQRRDMKKDSTAAGEDHPLNVMLAGVGTQEPGGVPAPRGLKVRRG